MSALALFDGAAPLAVRLRGEEAESVHLGHLVVVDSQGRVLFERGRASARIFARSALKPLQALPLLLDGAAERYGLSERAIAVALASHSGEPRHQAAVLELLESAGLEPARLRCGSHMPYHEPTATALVRAGQPPGVLHCNCSGKHAGMLAACQHAGWALDGYCEATHPLQQRIQALVGELSGCPAASLDYAVDGCGVPAWRLPLAGLARANARLATPASLPAGYRAAATRIAHAMAAHPGLIAGEGRLDTDLLAAAKGSLIAKIGGEAVHAGGVVGGELGWAIKVLDGNKRALGPALAAALAAVGHPLPPDAALASHTAPSFKNNLGAEVGRLVPAF